MGGGEEGTPAMSSSSSLKPVQACTMLVFFLTANSEMEMRIFVCVLFCLRQGFTIAQSLDSELPLFPLQVPECWDHNHGQSILVLLVLILETIDVQ